MLADSLADAVAGRGAFDGRPVPVRSLAILYSNYTHLVDGVVFDSRRRGSAGQVCRRDRRAAAPRSSRLAYSRPPASIPIATSRGRLGASESAGALKDGKIAAFFFSGGLPTAAVQDLAHTGMTIRLIPTGGCAARRCSVITAPYFPLEMPASAYRGAVERDGRWRGQRAGRQPRPCPTLAYDITRLLFDNAPIWWQFIRKRAYRAGVGLVAQSRTISSGRHQALSRKGRVEGVADGHSGSSLTEPRCGPGRPRRSSRLAARGRSGGIRDLLGSLHRSTAGLPGQLSAGCGRPHPPAVSGDRRTAPVGPGAAPTTGSLSCWP